MSGSGQAGVEGSPIDLFLAADVFRTCTNIQESLCNLHGLLRLRVDSDNTQKLIWHDISWLLMPGVQVIGHLKATSLQHLLKYLGEF